MKYSEILKINFTKKIGEQEHRKKHKINTILNKLINLLLQHTY